MPIKGLRKIKTELITPPRVGDIVEGAVLERGKSALFLDLGAKGVGIIFGREFFEAKNILKPLAIGDKITAKVVDLETEDGYRELSLLGANQELSWKELQEAKDQEQALKVSVKSANKGGLICQIKGIDGFLPASQLAPEHYPKVEGADPLKIAAELQKLVGQKIQVGVFDLNPAENKLIFSEKINKKEKAAEKTINCKPGDEVEGQISGVTNFGAFLTFGDGLEGLVPASEISQALEPWQKVKAKITEITNDRIYLSLKTK